VKSRIIEIINSSIPLHFIETTCFVTDIDNSKFEKIALIHANVKAMALLEWMKFVMKKNNALVVSIETMALIFRCSLNKAIC
jgi:hypothetical protein